MIKSVAIVPAILTNDKDAYKAQMEQINRFTKRVQIDVTDGVFTPATTLDLANIWWPGNWIVDLHLMVKKPSEYMNTILKLKPSLCILHAEASEDLMPCFKILKEAGIRTGLALLPSTFPGNAKHYIDAVDHILIFAGRLGEQGGQADMMQMEKIPLIRDIRPEVEIGWDGGANLSNIRALAHTDLDVINVGSAISKAENPAGAYQELIAEADKNGVVL